MTNHFIELTLIQIEMNASYFICQIKKKKARLEIPLVFAGSFFNPLYRRDQFHAAHWAH